MSPWDLIGWALIALVVGSVIVTVARITGHSTRHYIDHLRTRNVSPAVGQGWERSDGYTLWVENIYDNGRIGVCTKRYPQHAISSASWSDSPDEWRQRTRSGRYRLIEPVR